MRPLRLSAFLFAILIPLASAQSTLTTTFAAGNGQDGTMFDLVAIEAVVIEGFDLHLDSGLHDVEVWVVTGGGSHVGLKGTASAWTLIESVSAVVGAGQGSPTPLPLSGPLPIAAGETLGIYVTLVGSPPTSMFYSGGSAVGAVFAQDANLQILEGTGVVYPFGTSFQPRVWNGTVHYHLVLEDASYQINTGAARLSINGLDNPLGTEPIAELAWTGEEMLVTLDSNLVGSPFDVLIGTSDVLARDWGAVTLPSDRLVNIDLQDPTLTTLNGLSFLVPFAPFALNVFSDQPGQLCAQMLILSPAAPEGFELSAPGVLRFEEVRGQSILAPDIDPASFSSLPINILETPDFGAAPGELQSGATLGPVQSGVATLEVPGFPSVQRSFAVDLPTLTFREPTGAPIATLGDLFPPSLVPSPLPFGALATVDFELTVPVRLKIDGLFLAVPARAKTWVTNKGKSVVVLCDGNPNQPDLTQARANMIIQALGLGGRVTKVGPPTDSYDCHGWTFTCGVKWINNDQVQRILRDNGYVLKAANQRSSAGDLVVYKRGGSITHSGVVTMVDANGRPTEVESKWGRAGRYRHAPGDVPPSYGTPCYYCANPNVGRPGPVPLDGLHKLKCKRTP